MMETLLPYAVGPAGAVVVLGMVLYGVYKLVDEKLLPMASSWAERHLSQVDRIIAAHDADRQVWSQGMAQMQTSITQVQSDVHEIRRRLDLVLDEPTSEHRIVDHEHTRRSA